MKQQSNLLIHSFKEWAIAVSALQKGETILLLRKGGIREASHKFQIKYDRFWLYPTYEHQKKHLVKPQYRSQITEVKSGWHPATIEIQSSALITHSFKLSSLEILEKLEPYFVWNKQMIGERFKWKPQQPLTVLLLRVYNLPVPITIPFDDSYGGCKSWIDLQQPLTTEELTPVLSDPIYQQKVQEISQIIQDSI